MKLKKIVVTVFKTIPYGEYYERIDGGIWKIPFTKRTIIGKFKEELEAAYQEIKESEVEV